MENKSEITLDLLDKLLIFLLLLLELPLHMLELLPQITLRLFILIMVGIVLMKEEGNDSLVSLCFDEAVLFRALTQVSDGGSAAGHFWDVPAIMEKCVSSGGEREKEKKIEG